MRNYKIRIVFNSGYTVCDTLQNYSYAAFRYLVGHNEIADIKIYEQDS